MLKPISHVTITRGVRSNMEIARFSRPAILIAALVTQPGHALPRGEIVDSPQSNETETTQAGGPDGYYTRVDHLRCKDTRQAIVGLKIRRDTVLTQLQIVCAEIRCANGACGWAGGIEAAEAGGQGGGDAKSLTCGTNEVVSGYRATVKRVGQHPQLDYVEDIAIECAKVSGRPGVQNPWAAPLLPQPRSWKHAQQHLVPGAGAQFRAPGVCPATGATAVSVAVGRYIPTGGEVIQAMSLFCGKATWPAPYDKLSGAPPEQCRPYLEQDWREFEKCLLLAVELKPGRLPNLNKGRLEAWGKSNAGYNCYAYAATPYDPAKVWVGPRSANGPRPGDYSITSFDQLMGHLKSNGWQEVDPAVMKDIVDRNVTPRRGEERVVIYRDRYEGPQHAAFWDERGILAKMGEFGVFRFSSLDQMVGPAYGRPTIMLRNAASSTPR